MATLATPFAGPEACRTPVDAQYFDATGGVVDLSPTGSVELASFELPFGYCGLLEGFWQFTSTHAANNAEISTREFEWLLRINGQPLAPFLNLRTIIQPWGWPARPIAIRLPVTALVEFSVRVVQPPAPAIKVAGRIFGRYWFSEEES
jgi:hypothetical protein